MSFPINKEYPLIYFREDVKTPKILPMKIGKIFPKCVAVYQKVIFSIKIKETVRLL